jgi:hypothetical protein
MLHWELDLAATAEAALGPQVVAVKVGLLNRLRPLEAASDPVPAVLGWELDLAATAAAAAAAACRINRTAAALSSVVQAAPAYIALHCSGSALLQSPLLPSEGYH